MFVGDSLQRGQWQSFVCLVESVIPEEQKSLRRGRMHTVFKAKVRIDYISELVKTLFFSFCSCFKLVYFSYVPNSLGIQRDDRVLLGSIPGGVELG